jgi:hypothetical protein
LPQFFAFPNVDEGYAGVIRNTMSRPQFPVIDILRDKTSEVNGEAICGKNERRGLRRGSLITLSVKKICFLLQMLDVENGFETRFPCAIRRDLHRMS